MKRFIKTLLLLPVYSVMLVLILAALTCSYLYIDETYFPWNEKKTERIFNKNIEDAQQKGLSKIPLKTLIPFAWNKVCYFKTQDGEGGMQYPTPSSVWGKEYTGYVPSQSCDTFRHSDLFFFNEAEAHFVQINWCNVRNNCQEDFSAGLTCCNRSAYITFDSGKGGFIELNLREAE